jgi:hypothetical protein
MSIENRFLAKYNSLEKRVNIEYTELFKNSHKP